LILTVPVDCFVFDFDAVSSSRMNEKKKCEKVKIDFCYFVSIFGLLCKAARRLYFRPYCRPTARVDHLIFSDVYVYIIYAHRKFYYYSPKRVFALSLIWFTAPYRPRRIILWVAPRVLLQYASSDCDVVCGATRKNMVKSVENKNCRFFRWS